MLEFPLGGAYLVESEGVSVGDSLGEISESPDPKEKAKSTKNKSVKRPSSKSKKKTRKTRKGASGGGKTRKAIKYDPTESFMVLKHEIVDEKERKELEMMYGSLNLFPKILVSDPVVIKLGAKEGDIIRIHREEGFYYRLVVRS